MEVSPELPGKLLKSERRRLGVLAAESTYSSWQEGAACGDEDPELFFPIGNTGPAQQQIEDAKSVCRRCPVVDACLRYAIETDSEHGVWGGLSENERRALKRRRQRLNRANG